MSATLFIIGSFIYLGSSLIVVYFSRKRSERKYELIFGNLRIDREDPDGPYLFLELERPINDIAKNNIVSFKVVDESYTRE